MDNNTKPSLELIVYKIDELQKGLQDAIIELRTSRTNHESRIATLEAWKTAQDAVKNSTGVTVNNNGPDWGKITLALIGVLTTLAGVIYLLVGKH